MNADKRGAARRQPGGGDGETGAVMRTSRPNSTPIYANGKVVGHVRGGTFCKTLRSSVHFLRRPPAIAFDVGTLAQAREAGAVRARIYDRDTGRVYVASLDLIERLGVLISRGHGEQLALPLGLWRVIEPADAPRQLELAMA